MKVSEWQKHALRKLKESDIDSARLDSLLILARVLDKSKEWVLANPNELIHKSKINELDSLVKRRMKHQPIAQLLGEKDFYGHQFTITADVLTPRPETEELVDYVAKNAPEGAKLLDIGTGSGCIAISIKLTRPDLVVIASDISKRALKVAKLNASNLGAEVKFINSDLFMDINDSFDIICANLPYVPTVNHTTNKEIEFEPQEALFSGEDGLDHYRKFFEHSKDHLNPVGITIIEHDPKQLSAIRDIANITRLTNYVSVLG